MRKPWLWLLAIFASASIAAANPRDLALELSSMKPIAATHLATTLALSPDLARRAAIAKALEWEFPLFGDGAILDHLSRDESPAIRAACARAAWVRRARGGDLGVLARLADDPDPDVRSIATRAG
jgi:hypothetical protein